MEVARFALAAMAATLLLSSTLFEFTSSAPSFISPTVMPEDGSGDVSTDPPKEEGFTITTASSKPKGPPIKLNENKGRMVPLADQEVQKWRLTCPLPITDDNLKIMFLLLHANLEEGDYLQFNKEHYEGYKSTPTVIDIDKNRDTFLVSYVTQHGKSDFDLRYVCPYSNVKNCRTLHKCQAVIDYIADTPEAYDSLAKLCIFSNAIHGYMDDPLLCRILKRASTCGFAVPTPNLPC